MSSPHTDSGGNEYILYFSLSEDIAKLKFFSKYVFVSLLFKAHETILLHIPHRKLRRG